MNEEEKSSRKVYLDYNSTTPLAPEVLDRIHVVLRDMWANPSSGHEAGLQAKRCMDEARGAVARMLNVTSSDIIFTSGGTESNNMVLNSIAASSVGVVTASASKPHVVISNIEHSSVALVAHNLHKIGQIDLSVVCVHPKTGQVLPEDVVHALRPTTRLVSVMLANNETGVIQPVMKMVAAIRQWEEAGGGGGGGGKGRKIYVHTDAAQVLGKLPVDARALGVDYLSIAGHKMYGPRMGALYVRGLDDKATPLVPMMYGSGQERGYRSGTENTGMIAGLGRAAELVADHVNLYSDHMRTIRDYLEECLQVHFGEMVAFNVRNTDSVRIPNTSNISIRGKELRGSCVLNSLKRSQASVGAACHYHVKSASPVLLACGVREDLALNALRLSVGRDTSKADIDVFVEDLKEAVAGLRLKSSNYC